MTSIMQEAMLACIDFTMLMFKISAAKLATQKFLLIWISEKANFVLGKQGKLQIPTPDCQSQDTSHMDSFLWQQTWTACARNAWPSEGNRHDLLYPQGQGTKSEGKGCHVQPHHLFNRAQEDRIT
jgi:hypothetical protein